MPTTFANTIDGNEILAKRSQCDYAGNDLQTTYATKTEVTTGLSGKQDTVSDLATIRSGAALGATAVQPGDLAAVATTGAYSDLTGTPTIPPALSAGNGIDITNNVVSADIDGTSLTNGANGLSVTLPVPDTTGASQGDVLSVGQSGIEWVAPSSGSSDLFYATYSSTTFNEIQNAVNDGKYVILSHQGYLIPLDGLVGTGSFAKAYFKAISNPYDSNSRNNLRLTTYTCSYSNQWRYYNTFVPPDSSASDAGKVLTVNSSGNAEWATPSGGGSVTDVEVDGTSVVSGGVASITMPVVDQTYNSASTNAQSGVAVASAISTKQDTISDLSTIRSGAALGATAVQPGDLATVAETGDYDDLSNKPTILPYKPVVAGTGVRIVDDTANNRIVVEADETVLYDKSDSEGATLSNPTIALTETVYNFERIKIYWKTWNTSYGRVISEFDVSQSSVNFACIGSYWNGSNASTFIIGLTPNSDATQLTFDVGKFIYLGTAGTPSNAGYTIVYKIVGVHRIASN